MNPDVYTHLKKSVDKHFSDGLADVNIKIEGSEVSVSSWEEWYEIRFDILSVDENPDFLAVCMIDVLCQTKSKNSLRLTEMFGRVAELLVNIPILGEDNTCYNILRVDGRIESTIFTNTLTDLPVKQGIVFRRYRMLD